MAQTIFSVSKINSYIKGLFDRDYVLQNVWIEGEVSNYKLHASGHAYFTLKDANSAIACVLFKGYAAHIQVALQNGQKLVVKGRVSVYDRDGRYQIYVQDVVADGLGRLYEAYAQLKSTFEAKGYFQSERKKPIPALPKTVGIITSSTGAAIQDMIQVAKRRNPYCQLVLYPALVQGAGSKDSLIEGIRYFNTRRPVDVLILGRGGGSIEDLWSFNEAEVVEAIYASAIPIVSAVGHETDFTLSDFVADLRAETPSAAAELVVPDVFVILEHLDRMETNLSLVIMRHISRHRNQLATFGKRLQLLSPRRQLKGIQDRLLQQNRSLERLMGTYLEKKHYQLERFHLRLEHRNPLVPLSLGYAYVTDQEGHCVNQIDSVAIGDQVAIRLKDGTFQAQVVHKS